MLHMLSFSISDCEVGGVLFYQRGFVAMLHTLSFSIQYLVKLSVFMFLFCGPCRERKHSKSPDGGKTDSSGSFRTSDDEAREKDERYFISEEKNGCEAQVSLNYAVHLIDTTYKWIYLHIPAPVLHIYLHSAAETNAS